MKRGDVVLVRFPHPSGQRGKKRPAVVVQSDAYAGTVSTVVVTGTNFIGATAVKFDLTPAAAFNVDSATQITATVPAKPRSCQSTHSGRSDRGDLDRDR